MAEFTPRGLGIFRPTFYAGPSVCFIIREKWQGYQDGELQIDTTNVNDLETDLILNLGISPKIDAGFGYFFVDFRYSFGVSNIGLETAEVKDYGTVWSVEKRQLEITNSNILLSAGFSIKIKRFKKT